MKSLSLSAQLLTASFVIFPFFAGAILYFVTQVNVYHTRIEALLQTELETKRLLQFSADAETAGRGYTLILEPELLRPLTEARRGIEQGYDLPDAVPAALLADLEAFEQLVDRRIRNAEDFVARLDEGVISPDERRAAFARGRKLQDSVRIEAAAIIKASRAQLEIHRKTVGAYLFILVSAIGLTTVTTLSLIFFWRRALLKNQTIREDIERTYKTAFKDADIGIAILDAGGVIGSVNDSFLRLVGQGPGQVVGATLEAVFPQLAAQGAPEDGSAPGADSLRQTVIPHVSGGRKRFLRLFLPGCSRPDEDARRLLVAQDATAEIDNLEVLHRYEHLLDQAGEIAGFAAWSFEPATGTVLVGRAVAALLDLPVMEPVPLARLRSAIQRPDLRALSREARRCLRSGRPFELVIRAGAAPSEAALHDIQISGQCKRGADGAIWIEGSAQNVTQLHEQARAARRNEEKFRAIARVTNDVVWQVDMATRRLSFSSARDAGGLGALVVSDLDSFIATIHPEDRDSTVESFRRAVSSGAVSWGREFRYADGSGMLRFALSQAAFIRSEGKVTHIVGGFHDLTKRKQMQAAMQGMAATVASVGEQDFFHKMLGALAGGFEADAVCIARINPDGETATSLAVLVDGKPQENFTYEINGSPCENLLTEEECAVPRDLQSLFAGAGRIGELRAEAYIGGRLTGAGGKPIGFLFALFRKPVKRTHAMSSLLQVFLARVEAEIQRQDADKMLREQAELLDHAKEAIMVFDLDGRIRFWNRGAEALYGLPMTEAIGTDIARFYSDPAELAEVFNEVGHSEQVVREFAQHASGGEAEIYVEESWTLIRSNDGQPISILKVGSDVSERRRAEAQIRELAFFDSLSGLPNRRMFLENLNEARENALRSGKHGALLFFDMDNFKLVNDVHGHMAGDRFLMRVSEILGRLLGPEDFVARLGGDEFVVILQYLGPSAAEARTRAVLFAERAIADLHQPIDLGEVTVFSSASIGIALYCDDSLHINEQLRQADVAMYSAKEAGRNTYAVYDAEIHDQSSENAALIADLRAAAQTGQLQLWYQPQVDPLGRAYGAEALLRWRHPELGLIAPADFIPLAERSGLIVEIGRWVIAEACRQVAVWAETPELRGMKLSINVSVQQLRQDDFVPHFLDAIRVSGADPRRMMIEVTESVLEGKLEVTAAKLQVLRSYGIRVSLDDFGTGYSSLSRLRKMPFDEIKIDSSFVRDTPENQRDCAIVTSIISLGKTMNMRVVAEGVETARQLEFLRGQGCTAFQGYLFSRPLQQADFLRLIQESPETDPPMLLAV